ncbi:hypothetical protein [Pararhodospirillum photometricum]|nr:hypothetical protein [Pararhodospirillum photometricum]
MSAAQRLHSFSTQIDAAKRLTLGPGRQQELVALCRWALTEGHKINRTAIGHDIAARTLVNGVQAPIESVRSGGVVLHQFAVHQAAVDFAYETLKKLSPVETGNYKSEHQMLVNGESVDPSSQVGVDDIVIFVNSEPYTRRIEWGLSKKKAPNGVYFGKTPSGSSEAAYAVVRRRWGAVVTVAFQYIALFDGEIVRGKEANAPSIRYPALIIAPKGTRIGKVS